MTNKINPKKITLISLFTTVICISSVITIPLPFTAVPITLSLFGIILTALSLPLGEALLSVFAFLLLGLIGVPVFSSFRGGLWVLLSPTGGYILGYLPSALVISLVLRLFKKTDKSKVYQVASSFIAGLAGLLICYAFGLVQFSILTKTPLMQSLSLTVLPFILPDIFKILCAGLVAVRLKSIINKAFK